MTLQAPAAAKVTRQHQLSSMRTRGRGRGGGKGRGRGRAPKKILGKEDWTQEDWDEWMSNWWQWSDMGENWDEEVARHAWDQYAWYDGRCSALKLRAEAAEPGATSEAALSSKKRKVEEPSGAEDSAKAKAKAKPKAKAKRAPKPETEIKAAKSEIGNGRKSSTKTEKPMVKKSVASVDEKPQTSRKRTKRGGGGGAPTPAPGDKEGVMAEIVAFVEEFANVPSMDLREKVRGSLPEFKSCTLDNIYWSRPAVGVTDVKSGKDFAYFKFSPSPDVDSNLRLLASIKCAEIFAAWTLWFPPFR